MLFAHAAQAQEDTLSVTANKELLVGVHEQPPYALPGEGGSWDGISVKLWRAVADTLNLTYRFAAIDNSKSPAELLNGEFDLLLLGDVTSSSEAEVDFSHIYHTSQLGGFLLQQTLLENSIGIIHIVAHRRHHNLFCGAWI